MALVPGLVAVLRIVPPSNKVALRETVRRVLSASSTPRIVFGGGDARRKLARRASRWTRAVWGCSSHPKQPGRHASQGLGAFLRRSLLPKTGKIATQVAMHLYLSTASSR